VIEKMVHAKREQWYNEELASYLAQTLPCRGDRIIVDALGTDALHVAFVGNTTLDWLFVSS
jgi:predicted small integral membrane protein